MNLSKLLDRHKESKLSIEARTPNSQEGKDILHAIEEITSQENFYREVQTFQDQAFLIKLQRFIQTPQENLDVSLATFFAYKAKPGSYKMDTILSEYYEGIHGNIEYPLLKALKKIFEDISSNEVEEISNLYRRIRLMDTPPSFVDLLSNFSNSALVALHGLPNNDPKSEILWKSIHSRLKVVSK